MIGQAERIAELSKSVSLVSEGTSNPNVVAFTSGKGGTGKSFLALNLAYALAERGRRVLLIDFDLNFASQHILVDILPEFTIGDYLTNKAPIENVVHRYSDKLHFIFGESSTKHFEVTSTSLNRLLLDVKSLPNKYDFVFFDTAAGGNSQTITILKKSDFQVVVANPEPTAVMDAYVIIKLMIKNGIDSHSKYVVVNKAPDIEEGKRAFTNINKAVKNFLKREVNLLGIINDSEKIKKNSYTQQIFLKQNPFSSESEKIKAIGREISKFKQLSIINH